MRLHTKHSYALFVWLFVWPVAQLSSTPDLAIRTSCRSPIINRAGNPCPVKIFYWSDLHLPTLPDKDRLIEAALCSNCKRQERLGNRNYFLIEEPVSNMFYDIELAELVHDVHRWVITKTERNDKCWPVIATRYFSYLKKANAETISREDEYVGTTKCGLFIQAIHSLLSMEDTDIRFITNRLGVDSKGFWDYLINVYKTSFFSCFRCLLTRQLEYELQELNRLPWLAEVAQSYIPILRHAHLQVLNDENWKSCDELDSVENKKAFVEQLLSTMWTGEEGLGSTGSSELCDIRILREIAYIEQQIATTKTASREHHIHIFTGAYHAARVSTALIEKYLIELYEFGRLPKKEIVELGEAITVSYAFNYLRKDYPLIGITTDQVCQMFYGKVAQTIDEFVQMTDAKIAAYAEGSYQREKCMRTKAEFTLLKYLRRKKQYASVA